MWVAKKIKMADLKALYENLGFTNQYAHREEAQRCCNDTKLENSR